MADGNEVPFKAMVKFGVRNDKSRGLLIESLETIDGNMYFFKMHDQPINRHCQQIQNIVKAASVQRAKKLHIDVTDFMMEYFRPVADNNWEVEFRSTKLTSRRNQVEKVYTMRLNKATGIAKRMVSTAENKQAKIVANNAKISAKITAAESAFQIERARRIEQIFGGARGGRPDGVARGVARQGVAPQVEVHHAAGIQSPLPDDSEMDE